MKELERSFCTVYFDNFFNSLKLIEKTIPKRHLQYWNSSSQQKQMPKMIDDKQMNRGDCKLLFSVNTVTCKWIDNLSVPLLSYALEGMNYILSVQRREKCSSTKFLVRCPKVVKLYSATWVGLVLWTNVLPHIVWIESHLLDFTSAFSLIWWILHVSIATSFATWVILTNCFSLITRFLLQKILIKYYQDRKRALPMSRPSKRKNQPKLIDNHGRHLPDYQTMRKRCAYCAMEGKENRTFLICLACNIPLCLVKEINCFQKHHV